MKKFVLSFFATVCLVISSTSVVLGAIHNYSNEFNNWATAEMILSYETILNPLSSDSWFKVQPESPFIRLYYTHADEMNVYAADFYQNDQTFADLVVYPDAPWLGNFVNFRGGYLFDFGLFVGIDYYSLDNETYYYISPGYRINLGDNGYVALSLDYLNYPDYDIHQVVGYDLDLKYYWENAKVYLQYYVPVNGPPEALPTYDIGAAATIAPKLTVGFDYSWTGEFSIYDAGLTWSPDIITLDLMTGKMNDQGVNLASGMFNLTGNVALGAESMWVEGNSDARIMLKFKYMNDRMKFNVGYVLENNSYESMVTMNLKYTF